MEFPYSDLTLFTKSGKKYKVSRAIMNTVPLFKTTFNSGMSESEDPEFEVDIEDKYFKEMLVAIHNRDPVLTIKNFDLDYLSILDYLQMEKDISLFLENELERWFRDTLKKSVIIEDKDLLEFYLANNPQSKEDISDIVDIKTLDEGYKHIKDNLIKNSRQCYYQPLKGPGKRERCQHIGSYNKNTERVECFRHMSRDFKK